MVRPQDDPNDTQRAAIARGIDLARLPRHVAIIMDGNGRWAKARRRPRLFGHREGYKTLKRVLLLAGELGIEVLTVYAFSSENWNRPPAEVAGLMRLIQEAARNELAGLVENNVRVHLAGRIDELPAGPRAALEDLVSETAQNTGIRFVLAIGYGGRAEIVDAVKRAAERVEIADLTERDVSDALYLPELPEPDLMIRTSGEMRWSNFLIWQAAYAELWVTPDPWPDFELDHLLDATLDFQSRHRKFGGL